RDAAQRTRRDGQEVVHDVQLCQLHTAREVRLGGAADANRVACNLQQLCVIGLCHRIPPPEVSRISLNYALSPLRDSSTNLSNCLSGEDHEVWMLSGTAAAGNSGEQIRENLWGLQRKCAATGLRLRDLLSQQMRFRGVILFHFPDCRSHGRGRTFAYTVIQPP